MIFHHKYQNNFFPNDKSLCKISKEAERFNSIGKLSNLFKNNGVYEFMLDYLDVGNIVWQQSVLPTEIIKTSTENVPGFKILFNLKNFVKFTGLKTSNVVYSCFDGSSYSLDNFRYSIGTIYYVGNAIPGPFNQNYNTVDVNEVILWIRSRIGITNMSSSRFSFSRLCIVVIFLV